MSIIGNFIHYQRKNNGLTQEELALRAGVGLRFIRELEKGKPSVQLDKVEQVLQLFGFQLTPSRIKLDAYEMVNHYLNKGVRISLATKEIKQGILLKEIIDPAENQIAAWQFLPNKDIILFQKTSDAALLEEIPHNQITAIEYQ